MKAGRLALALRLPPHVVIKRAAGLIRRKIDGAWDRLVTAKRPTYGTLPPSVPFIPLLDSLHIEHISAQAHWITPLAALYRDHYFDLLGSGWVQNVHGMRCAGLEGHVFPPAPSVKADPSGEWLINRINPANLAESRKIWSLVDPDYRPIDWQLDFKSGYRWSENQWSATVPFGHLPGIDIKVPWELARMQHLPILAFAHMIDGDPANSRAFRNQVLDFIATNPPQFGVNWRCAMDVAIRAANLVLARDLFRLAKAEFDNQFDRELARSLTEHGRFIVQNLEWFPEGRGNHYLANISGVLFIAAALPPTSETDQWLAFAAQELLAETAHQFDADGANFEASTCYHRLSAEMALFGAALLSGLSSDRRDTISRLSLSSLKTKPSRPLGNTPRLPDAAFFAALEGMAEFTRTLTKPNHRVAQIGDNDSGRFFKLHPIVTALNADTARNRYANLSNWSGLDVYWDEDFLDHRPLISGISALVDRPDLAQFSGTTWIDYSVVQALTHRITQPASGQKFGAARRNEPCSSTTGDVLEIQVPGDSLTSDLELFGYPHFGIWVCRSSRLFLAVRCGPLGQKGRGGHDHNDQLSIELSVDGQDWLCDPGTYLYTALRSWRNAYRSVAAHAAPRFSDLEPASLSLGDFWLGTEAKAECEYFETDGFVGRHDGYGRTVRRSISIEPNRILIIDSGLDISRHRTVSDPVHVRAAIGQTQDFSPGYGIRCNGKNP